MPSPNSDNTSEPDKEVTSPAEDISTVHKPEKTLTKVTRINRFNIGTIILIQIILAFVSVCLFNYLTSDKHIRQDLTAGSQYTLSEFSLGFLKGEQVKNHPDTIKIFVIAKQNPQYTLRLRSILEEYSRNSATEIDVEFIDRVRNANRLNEISAIYSKSFHEDSILIDARTESDKSTIQATDTTALTQPSNEEKSVSLKRIRQFPISELFKISEDSSRIAAWQDEKIAKCHRRQDP